MNATIAHVNKSIWPLTFDQLHRDSQEWLSLAGYWKGEVRFLEKAMRHFLGYALTTSQAVEMRNLFNDLMASIKPEIREIEGWVRSFHRHLACVANPRNHQRELKNNTEHRRIYRKIDSFRKRLRTLKHQLFALLAQVIRDEKNAQGSHRGIWAYQPAQLLRRSG